MSALNELEHQWKPEEDALILKHGDAIHGYTKLARHFGMSRFEGIRDRHDFLKQQENDKFLTTVNPNTTPPPVIPSTTDGLNIILHQSCAHATSLVDGLAVLVEGFNKRLTAKQLDEEMLVYFVNNWKTRTSDADYSTAMAKHLTKMFAVIPLPDVRVQYQTPEPPDLTLESEGPPS